MRTPASLRTPAGLAPSRLVRNAGLIAFIGLLGPACSDGGLSNSGAPDLAAAAPDLAVVVAPPDLAVAVDLTLPPDLANPYGIGQACPNGSECATGLVCAGPRLSPALPGDGYCTKNCHQDADCGAGAFCGPAIGNGGNVCFLRCDANGTCASARQVCSRRFGGYIDLVNTACIPGNPLASDGSPCKNFGDCNKNQACVNNAIDWPGGACVTLGCTPGDATTCAPGGKPSCIHAGTIDACFPTCATDGDCRAAEGYRCVDPPALGQKVCLVPNPIGANCKADADCAGGTRAFHCIVDQNVPNGYCTLVGCDAKANTGCPSNGTCVAANAMTSLCLKTCTVDAECQKGTTCKMVSPGTTACAP